MFVILCGKSASGKDTLSKSLQKCGYIPIVSVTDRPMRQNEKEGVEYYFKTPSEFSKLIKNDKFIEHRSYTTKYNNKKAIFRYGTESFELDHNKNYVAIKDPASAAILKEYGGDEAIVIYLDIPDEVRKSRCINRGDFDETEWNRRLERDSIDFSNDKLEGVVDHSIDGTTWKTNDLVEYVLEVCEERKKSIECIDKEYSDIFPEK